MENEDASFLVRATDAPNNARERTFYDINILYLFLRSDLPLEGFRTTGFSRGASRMIVLGRRRKKTRNGTSHGAVEWFEMNG